LGGLALKSVGSLNDERTNQTTGARIMKVMKSRKLVRKIAPAVGAFLPLRVLHLFAAARS
jgi:hypothetical protein